MPAYKSRDARDREAASAAHKRWIEQERIQQAIAAVAFNRLFLMTSPGLTALYMRVDHTMIECLTTSDGRRPDARWRLKTIDKTMWVDGTSIRILPRQIGDICHVLAVHGQSKRALEIAIANAP